MNIWNFFKNLALLASVFLINTAYCELIEVSNGTDLKSGGKVSIVTVGKDGTKKKSGKVTAFVSHDSQNSAYKSERSDSDGLKLEGVKKSDLEDLYYGTKIMEHLENGDR